MPEPRTVKELQAEHPAPPPSRRDPRRGEHDEQSPLRNYVRDVILGLNDGIVSVYALVAGVSGAAFASREVALAGLAAAIAGAVSMALGEYLSTKAQAQYYAAEGEREREHIRRHPDLEREELRQMLREKDYPQELVEPLTDHIASDEDRFVSFMMREEFGVGRESERSPAVAMLVVGIAFLAGAALPVVPYLLDLARPLGWATAASVGGLALAGAVKGAMAGLSPVKSGAEMAALGSIAAAITFGVGAWIGTAL